MIGAGALQSQITEYPTDGLQFYAKHGVGITLSGSRIVSWQSQANPGQGFAEPSAIPANSPDYVALTRSANLNASNKYMVAGRILESTFSGSGKKFTVVIRGFLRNGGNIFAKAFSSGFNYQILFFSNTFRFTLYSDLSGAVFNAVQTTETFGDGYHTVVITYDGTITVTGNNFAPRFTFYVDNNTSRSINQAASAGTGNFIPTGSLAFVTLGARSDDIGGNAMGYNLSEIQDLLVYNKVLSNDEVVNVMATGRSRYN